MEREPQPPRFDGTHPPAHRGRLRQLKCNFSPFTMRPDSGGLAVPRPRDTHDEGNIVFIEGMCEDALG